MNSKLLIAPELNERRTNFKICIQIINDEHGCTDIKKGNTNFIIGRAYKVKVMLTDKKLFENVIK